MSIFRKIVFVTANRSDYAKVRPFIKLLSSDTRFELNVFATGTMSAEDYGTPVQDIISDGITPALDVYCGSGDTLPKMVKSIGLAMIDLASYISRIKPDCGIVVGDRWDILPAAVSLSMMNIPVIHIQGGEISGTVDNLVRDVITKLSHVHFTATDQARDRVVSMGESSDNVFNTGCPSIDFINSVDVGGDVRIDMLKPYIKDPCSLSVEDKYIMVALHPNVTDPEDVDAEVVYKALSRMPNKKVWFYPNNDPFNRNIVKVIRRHHNDVIKFSHISMESFIMLMAHSGCIVGNSSSGIRESASVGIYAVNIGKRQDGRERNANVVDIDCNEGDVFEAVNWSIGRKYLGQNLYGDGNSSKKMIDILAGYKSLNYKNVRCS